ncbi:Ger(x)C family spore germination protein [Metabacillus sediminilitoris]|uniref:Ger(X)C family spore germination protein n=1 Tax=Metabacillus sediminilitoris TaxID=2567941 RepID=A0A4S4BKN6_9BACI|nr:Ger(x)C family spore germination protein [Metabacillus sediminilitoris]QGQ45792.1 Ger(x)C family spore germination protein [Metabacillus sediminilitoris]THF74348.1 Ger(x)C family spore germination protein [Metabacillus sediminilitoris]
MKQSYNNLRSLKRMLSVILLLFLTGCWSSHEIEELGLTVGLALDEGKESTTEKELKEQGGEYNQTEKITVTYQFVNPKGTGSESKGGGSQQKPYLNISETGDSIHQMTREFSLRGSRPMFSPHLKVIVISEDLVRKYSLEQLLDQFLRDNEIRPSCLVVISKGRAIETLESNESGEIPAFRLIGISDNEDRTTRILPPMSLAKLEGKMQSGSSFLLQNVISTNGEVKFSGAAVITGKTKQLLGFLNEEELDGLTWITGKGKGGLVKNFDQETNQPFIYEVKSMKSKITPHINGNNISFDVKIESEGRLSENWVVSGENSGKNFLKRAEKAAEEEVNRLVNNVGGKMQKDYQVDVAGFGNRLRIEHPKVWEKVKEDWDQTFSEVPIEYNVKLTIIDYGASSFKK